MGLSRYGSTRVRFTWQNRKVNISAPRMSQKVLSECKDQRSFGGKCVYFAICAALEAHQRLKTDKPRVDLSWRDLETKETALTDVNARWGRVSRSLMVVQREGVCYEGSEDTLKIKEFERIDTRITKAVASGIRKYMKVGPMIGTFEVFGDQFDQYGQSEHIDELYVVNETEGVDKWTHTVNVTGFGIQAKYPFWEFQNSYGPMWRGAARGFGQIYAVHLGFLYGLMLL